MQNAAKAGKKVVKTAAKIATAPARLGIKAALEILLPQAAPFFLYLFIMDQKTIQSLPPKARAQRNKATQIAKFITGAIGMKNKHFMGIVRNGITKQMRMSPEQVIAKQLKGGVGALPAIIGAIKPLLQLIKKISKIFGKKGPGVSESDAPDPDADFSDVSEDERKRIISNTLKGKSDPENEASGGKFLGLSK